MSIFPDLKLKPGASADDLRLFPKATNWRPQISWDYLGTQVLRMQQEYNLNIEPDYQRGHVWTPDQRVAYLEYKLVGGEAASDILFVTDSWYGRLSYVNLIDGFQRLNAVLAFMRDEFTVFGLKASEFDQGIFRRLDLTFRMFEVQSRAQEIQFYLLLNSGGTPHSQEHLQKARSLLDKATKGDQG